MTRRKSIDAMLTGSGLMGMVLFFITNGLGAWGVASKPRCMPHLKRRVWTANDNNEEWMALGYKSVYVDDRDVTKYAMAVDLDQGWVLCLEQPFRVDPVTQRLARVYHYGNVVFK